MRCYTGTWHVIFLFVFKVKTSPILPTYYILKKHGGFTSTTTASVCFPKAFDSLDAASIKLVGQVCGRVALCGPLVDSFCCWLDSVSLSLMFRLLNDATYPIYTAHISQRDVPLQNYIPCESVLPEFLKIVFFVIECQHFFQKKTYFGGPKHAEHSNRIWLAYANSQRSGWLFSSDDSWQIPMILPAFQGPEMSGQASFGRLGGPLHSEERVPL